MHRETARTVAFGGEGGAGKEHESGRDESGELHGSGEGSGGFCVSALSMEISRSK